MLPLPSGLPPALPLSHPPPRSSTPPPPPPPPPLSIAAFTSAAANASRYPPGRRRPTLHIIVVHASTTVALLRHAHQVLVSLSAKGVHVFLQTEVEHVPTRAITPITPDAVPDVVAACRADFLVLIADRNLPQRTVQLRLRPTEDFRDVRLSELADVVLDSWVSHLRSVPDHHQMVSLAMNPNVITTTHLDMLLREYSGIPAIRRSYARLARLVNVTQEWEHTDQTSHVNLGSQLSKQYVSVEPPSSSHAPSPVGNHSTERAEAPVSVSENHDTEFSENTSRTELLANLPKEALAEALQRGLRSIAEVQKEHDSAEDKHAPKSDITFSWMKRSEHMSARLLRFQLHAAHLHRRLIQAFDMVSQMPLAPSSMTHFNPAFMPTEAHRQRLLREINDLIPRIEELGSRLSKRPRTRRRRRSFHAANPWDSYLRRAATSNDGQRVAGATGDASKLADDGGWQCCVCNSFNEQRIRDCRACRVRTYVVDPALWPAGSKRLTKRFHDAVKNAPGVSSPWIFAPVVMPLQPPVNSAVLNGIMSTEQGLGHRTPRGSPVRNDDVTSIGRPDMSLMPSHSQDSNNPHPQHVDLTSSFQSITFGEDYSGVGDAGRFGKVNRESETPRRNAQIGERHFPIPRDPATKPPVRLASSAPNSSSFLDYAPQRIPNGMHPVGSPESAISQHFVGHTPPQRMFSREKQNSTRISTGSGYVDSNSGPDAFRTKLSFDQNPIDGSSHISGSRAPQDSISYRPYQGNENVANKAPYNSAMEELAHGSYEAIDGFQRLVSTGPRASNPVAVPAAPPNGESRQNDIASLEALAAASDAANGGIGSATKESLRAVSAVVTPGRGQSRKHSHSQGKPNGMYNMF